MWEAKFLSSGEAFPPITIVSGILCPTLTHIKEKKTYIIVSIGGSEARRPTPAVIFPSFGSVLHA